MIEQHTITTTQKYNFPQQNMDLTLPKRLFEQSLHSLNRLNHQYLQLNQQYPQQINDNNTYESPLQIRKYPIHLNPSYQETTIGAVDTSTIKIGETSKGILIAIR